MSHLSLDLGCHLKVSKDVKARIVSYRPCVCSIQLNGLLAGVVKVLIERVLKVGEG